MKRLLISLSLVLLMIPAMRATHLMGGEITARQIGALSYEITLTTYRDTVGIPMQSQAVFRLRDSIGISLFTSSTGQDTVLSGGLLQGIPYGVEIYKFIDTIQLPNQGRYTIEWQNCCRNGAIINMGNPLSESMHFETTLTAKGANSTPTFLVPPITFLPKGQPWQYNALPVDRDGDSLVWSIDTPLTDIGQYVSGYQTPLADTSNPFTINAQSGTITWTADTTGNFVVSLLVEEYRQGQKIGEIRRDMQMVVIDNGNHLPSIANWNQFNQSSQGYSYVTVPARSTFRKIIKVEDPDQYDQVHLQGYGEAFNLPQNPATLTILPDTSGSNRLQAELKWQPSSAQIRTEPYRIVLRSHDHQFAQDHALLIYVNTQVDLDQLPQLGNRVQLYPHPVQKELQLEVKFPQQGVLQGAIYNTMGRKVDEWKAELQAGKQKLSRSVNLAQGSYILRLKMNGRLLHSQSFLVQ